MEEGVVEARGEEQQTTLKGGECRLQDVDVQCVAKRW